MSGLDRRTFLDIVATLPTGVTVVTTMDAEGRPHGLTVSAVCSVSADPPLLLVCIDHRSRTLPILRDAGRFAVNFLRGDRESIGRRFASPVPDRFAGLEWREIPPGVPILDNEILSFAACRIVQKIEAGDHVILVGLAVAGLAPPPLSRPLTYFRRNYEPWPGDIVRADDPGGLPAPATEPAEVDRLAG